MAFTADGDTPAISLSRNAGQLWIYCAETGALVANLKPRRTGINSLAFTEDQSLLFCDNEGTLRTVWEKNPPTAPKATSLQRTLVAPVPRATEVVIRIL